MIKEEPDLLSLTVIEYYIYKGLHESTILF